MLLWRFHRIHHGSPRPDWLASARVHHWHHADQSEADDSNFGLQLVI